MRTQTAAGSTGASRAEGVPLPLDVLGSRICAAASRMASATCQWLEMVGDFDARAGWAGVGIRSCAHWLAWTCSESPGVAREHVRVARAMRDLPLARAEFAAGRLSYSKMREITRVSDRVDESTLVDLARTATASQLARAVRGMRRADEEALTPQARRRVDWYTDDVGMLRLRAALPAEEGALVLAAIHAAHLELDAARARAAAPRSAHADALLQVARGYLAGAPRDESGEDRTTVVLHVDSSLLTVDHPTADRPSVGVDAELADHTAITAHDCCQVAGVGGVSRQTAARLACDAVVIAMVRGAGGAVLGHGRRRRLVSAPQRRSIMVRDGHCQFPACGRTSHLQIHHVRQWAAGGSTDLDNLIALCPFHHVACHEGGVAIRPGLAALPGIPRWDFYAPDGAGLDIERLRARFRADEDFLSWCTLLQSRPTDGSAGPVDPRAEAIRPRWAGEPFHLPEVVAALLGNPKIPDTRPRAA
jgi:hypothetical protein